MVQPVGKVACSPASSFEPSLKEPCMAAFGSLRTHRPVIRRREREAQEFFNSYSWPFGPPPHDEKSRLVVLIGTRDRLFSDQAGWFWEPRASVTRPGQSCGSALHICT